MCLKNTLLIFKFFVFLTLYGQQSLYQQWLFNIIIISVTKISDYQILSKLVIRGVLSSFTSA